jgi:uncharacterized protein (DUF779 family)
MRVTGTRAAATVVERVRRDRRGELVFTLGTGCCESTAPFLYEDFWPGPDQEVVGTVADVPVYAPEYLRRLYPGTDGVVIDVDEGRLAESMSIETEHSCRFVLRNREGGRIPGQEGDEPPPAPVPRPADAPAPEPPGRTVDTPASALRPRGPRELPEALRRARLR